MDLSAGIGQRIKKALKDAGYTQAKATEELGLSENAITNYVTKDRVPKAEILYKLAKLCKVPMETLLTGEDMFEQLKNAIEFALIEVGFKPGENLTEVEKEKNTYLSHPDAKQDWSAVICRSLDQEGNVIFEVTLGGRVISPHKSMGFPSLSDSEADIISKYRKLDARDQLDIKDCINLKLSRTKKGTSSCFRPGEQGSGEEATAKEYA